MSSVKKNWRKFSKIPGFTPAEGVTWGTSSAGMRSGMMKMKDLTLTMVLAVVLAMDLLVMILTMTLTILNTINTIVDLLI